MNSQDKRVMSSKQLLEKIGLGDDYSGKSNFIPDDEDDQFESDVVPMLRERYHQLKQVRHTLTEGMVVKWKSGLKNRRAPAYGKPAIVSSVLDTPAFDTNESGSTYFREPLDIVVGFFLDERDHRGEFIVFHFDLSRFQPFFAEDA